ncbi:hypothetical protein HDU92_009122 [Lobulomyces angularis]|nr:hypothetical protein HDU92_009122 [Lobulomyces angularis]
MLTNKRSLFNFSKSAASNNIKTTDSTESLKSNPVHEPVESSGEAKNIAENLSESITENIPSDTAYTDLTSSIIDSTEASSLFVPKIEPVLESIQNFGDIGVFGMGGGWSPIGWSQSLLEAIYVSTGLPWWGTIIAATLLVRIVLFPLMVKTQRSAAIMQNIKHLTEPVQNEMKAARARRDLITAQEKVHELHGIFKEYKINPFSGVIGILQTGGIAWFTNLSAPDPFCILPVAASAGMITIMQSSGITNTLPTEQMEMMRKFFLGMAVVMVPMTYHLPSAIFLYWLTTNSFTYLQMKFLKIPAVMKYFNIPENDPAGTISLHTNNATSTLTLNKMGYSEAVKKLDFELKKKEYPQKNN